MNPTHVPHIPHALNPSHVPRSARSPHVSHVPCAPAALGAEGWSRPWSGTNGEACVEVKVLIGGRVAVRQSTDPGGPALIFPAEAIAAFVAAAKDGRADFLARPDLP